MHKVRNQPQGIIELPGEQPYSDSPWISDQDQTLELTLHRLAQENNDVSSGEQRQHTGTLLSESVLQQKSSIEIVFADSVRLELELAAEMQLLLARMQKANLRNEPKY